MEIIFEGIDLIERLDGDPEAGLLARFTFVENQKLLNTVNAEEIGSLEILHQTKPSQCIAKGKGLEVGTVGGQAQFVLTTRNAQGKQCNNEHDRVTVEIRDEQGRQCATEVRINDNKDGSYKIIYSAKEQGRYKVTIKVNGGHVLGSPSKKFVCFNCHRLSSIVINSHRLSSIVIDCHGLPYLLGR